MLVLTPMAHDPSSPSKLLVPECMADYPSYWYEIPCTSNLDGEPGLCAIGLRINLNLGCRRVMLDAKDLMEWWNNGF